MVKGSQKGGSCSSNKVGGTALGDIKAPTFMEDIFNVTETMPVPSDATNLVGGAKKSKKATKSSNGKKHTKKRSLKSKKTKGSRKMTSGAKRRTMRGGGVANLMGCGPVNNASTFNNPGCDRETIMNPPNLGTAGSGLVSIDGHAAI